MKFITVCVLFLASICLQAQPDTLSLLFHWDNPVIEASYDGDNRYNEVFGFVINGEEYAVIGSTLGAHIFSLKNNEEKEVAFIEGSTTGRQVIHRDFDVYDSYLYMVADQGEQSTLQIVDLSQLPERVELVYDTNEYIIRSHNIFIDSNSRRLYSCGGALSGLIPGLAKPNHLSIFSLENPREPKLLLDCREQLGFWRNIGYIHDIFVRNDTAYCNAANKGMFVIDFSSLSDVKILGSLREYEHKGYNHQGFLHASKALYVMTDETHGMDVKMIDVSDFKEMEIIDRFNSGVSANYSVPHNVYFRDDFVYVSYYADGVYVFDASNPNDVKTVFFYDTNEKEPDKDFDGCWGVYPFLPSGKILASDMRNGLFVFRNPFEPIIEPPKVKAIELTANLVQSELRILNDWGIADIKLELVSVNGQNVFNATLTEGENVITLPGSMASGWYSARLSADSLLKFFRFYKY